MSSTAPRAGAQLTRRANAAAAVAVAIAAIATGACARRDREPGGGAQPGDRDGEPRPGARDVGAREDAVVLWFGGDVHLGAAGAAGDELEADRRLAPLAPLLAGAAGIVNLEGAVGERAAREGELINHPARLAGLRRAGVIAAGIANNHAHDLGGPADGEANAAALRANDLLPVGGPAGVAVIVRDGVRIAITAHDLAPGRPLDTGALAADLGAARAKGDVLIATFHVTGPPSYLPPREALTAVAVARTAGAAVIAVHGSHALGRVERTADTVTAWGLGNLLFACACTDEEDALILRVTVDRHGLVDAEVVPIAAGLRGAPARPADDPSLIYDLLASLRSTPLAADGPRARLLPP